ncbi:protocadherin Fat 1 [Trichonephila inaurata madagascariensis]|uniref:Protocadherin Fat 1 n=1 Tax=Trichonephila inaurata madagascariensis TaxID=2747483 RepID=A0A8X7CHL1_9ARAC|nr:protocadherin Fat 1 [Trichonephila inaurata madagascariensis]
MGNRGNFFWFLMRNIRTRAVLDRETSLRYWLTVIAQDRGAVPLTSRLDVYVEVEDENDNIPLTFEPVYYSNIPENSPEGTTVVKMEAFDLDVNPDQRISYHVTAGDPQSYFSLDSATALATTEAMYTTMCYRSHRPLRVPLLTAHQKVQRLK